MKLIVCALALLATAMVAPIGAPPDGMGQIIFYRSGSLAGALISCAVHEDGEKVTSLPRGHYAVIDVQPGQHVFTVASEAKSSLKLDVKAGKTYYSKCIVGAGIMAGRPHLRLVDESAFTDKADNLKIVQ